MDHQVANDPTGYADANEPSRVLAKLSEEFKPTRGHLEYGW
jgi:hypothetical protein